MPILKLLYAKLDAKCLLNIAEQTVIELAPKRSYIDIHEAEILIMKGIIKWEETRQVFPEYGKLDENKDAVSDSKNSK